MLGRLARGFPSWNPSSGGCSHLGFGHRPSCSNGSHAWPVPTPRAPPAAGELASAGGETASDSAGLFCGQLTTRGRGVRTTRPKRSELSPLGSAGAGPTWWARGCVYRHLPLFIALGGRREARPDFSITLRIPVGLTEWLPPCPASCHLWHLYFNPLKRNTPAKS